MEEKLKKCIVLAVFVLLLAAVLVYAGNGNLIVQGKLGIGTTSPSAFILDANGSFPGVPAADNYAIKVTPSWNYSSSESTAYSNYGLYLDTTSEVTASSIAPNAYGLYNRLFLNAGANTGDAYGAYNFALNSSGTAISNMFGIYNYAYFSVSETGGTADQLIGSYNYVRNHLANINTAYGTSNYILQNNTAGSINTAIGTNTCIYANPNGSIGDAYGEKINFASSGFTGTKWGVYVTNEHKNYFSHGVGIGTTDFGTGSAAALVFGNGSKPTSLTNAAGLYAKNVGGTTELYSFDEAGNETQQTSHAMDAPDFLYDPEDGLPMIIREVQYYLGYVRYTNLTRQARLSGMTDDEKKMLTPQQRTCVFRESFADYMARTGEVLNQLDWDTEQVNIKARKDVERQAMINKQTKVTAALNAKKVELANAKSAETKAELERTITEYQKILSELEIPAEYQMKPIPSHLRTALGQ